jgi:hypothetical protein
VKNSIACLPSEGKESCLSYVVDLWYVKEPCDLWGSQNRRPNWLAISHPIPSFTNRGLSCRLTWSTSGDDGRN